MSCYSIAEAKAHFSGCIARAEAGEAVVITRHGKPAAVLVAAGTHPDSLKPVRVASPVAEYDGKPPLPMSPEQPWRPVWGAVPGLRVRVSAAEAAAPVFPAGVPWHDQDPV